jgi:hypothetical protein
MNERETQFRVAIIAKPLAESLGARMDVVKDSVEPV